MVTTVAVSDDVMTYATATGKNLQLN